MTAFWDRPGEEPTLNDVLTDPIVHLVMKRDGLTREGVGLYLEAQRRRLLPLLVARLHADESESDEAVRRAS